MGATPVRGSAQICAVIPTYNRGHLIARAIDSALGQSQPASGIIVIDDGSTDDTAARVKVYGEKVRYIHQPNAGASAARNRGVAEADLEWVAFLDSDDVWMESHLERMACTIDATGGAASYYFSDMIMATARCEQSLWEMLGFRISGEYEFRGNGGEWVMCRWPPMMLQSSVFKRSIYLASGGLWERLRTCHDTHLFIKLGLTGPICAVAGCGARMTADAAPESRLTAGLDRTVEGGRQRLLMYQDLLQTIPDLNPADRRELVRCLAGAHRRLAKFGWRDRQFWAVVPHLLQSAVLDPGFYWQRMTGSPSAAEQSGAGQLG